MRIEALKSALKNLEYDELYKFIGILFLFFGFICLGKMATEGDDFEMAAKATISLVTFFGVLFFLWMLGDTYGVELRRLKSDKQREENKGASIYDVWDNDDFAMDNKMSDEELAEFKQSVELKNRAKRAGRIN